jgi:hypothetical protein
MALLTVNEATRRTSVLVRKDHKGMRKYPIARPCSLTTITEEDGNRVEGG